MVAPHWNVDIPDLGPNAGQDIVGCRTPLSANPYLPDNSAIMFDSNSDSVCVRMGWWQVSFFSDPIECQVNNGCCTLLISMPALCKGFAFFLNVEEDI